MMLKEDTRFNWTFIRHKVKMPKSFLMNGKKRTCAELLSKGMEDDEISESSEESCPDSPKSFKSDRDGAPIRHGFPMGHPGFPMGHPGFPIGRPGHYERLSPPAASTSGFAPSVGSAFSKIEKPEIDTAAKQSAPTSLFPGFYPSVYPYNMSAAGTATTQSALHPFGIPYTYSQVPSPNTHSEQSESDKTESPEKNMYYYVDPRIPFTNYFMNLTKLLSNSKECKATTPLAKIAGDDNRADDRDTSALSSPESEKCRNNEVTTNETHSPAFRLHSENDDDDEPTDTSEPRDTKTVRLHDQMRLPVFPSPQFLNPFINPLLHPSTPQSILSLPGGGIYHPALMQIPGGAGFRRLNPEKPPPVKKYKCDVCGKAFSRSNTLVTHKRIHTGDKPFKCEVCGRAFRQPGNLTRHRLTHTTVKPYICPTCGKAFNRASNLHTHMRIHTHVKAFVCPYCGKAFHQKIDMKIHCYTHTGRRELPPPM